MKIGIDITPIIKDKAGIGFLTYSLVKALSEIDTSNSYELFTNKNDTLIDFELPSNFKIRVVPANNPGLQWMIKSIKYLKSEHFDRFFSTSNFFWSIGFNKTIQLVNDLAPIKYPEFFTKKGSLFYNLQLRLSLRRARYVVTISQTVLKELLEINNKPNKSVITLGLHDWVFDEPNHEYYDSIKMKYDLPEKYFIAISTLEPRKNHIGMIKGFHKFSLNHPEYKLVIVGKKGWFYESIFKTVEELRISDHVIFTGYAPDQDLVGLVDLSSGGIMLSFYEGFGIPIIEILARHKKMLVSDISVFKEITSGLANTLFANPNSSDSIENGLNNLLSQKFVTHGDVGDKYNWEQGAEDMLQVFNRA